MTTPDESTDKPKHFAFSLSQILGGALAAATASFLGSRLGVAGTIFGAALGSVIAAVASTLYVGSLQVTKTKVRKLWVRNAEGELTEVTEVGPEENVESDDAPATKLRRRWLAGGAVVAAVLSALAMFVVAMVLITGAEFGTGHTVDGRTGTTIGNIGKPSASPEPSPSASATASPSASATPTPTPSATASATPTPEPSGSPTAEPSITPTQSVVPTTSPTS